MAGLAGGGAALGALSGGAAILRPLSPAQRCCGEALAIALAATAFVALALALPLGSGAVEPSIDLGLRVAGLVATLAALGTFLLRLPVPLHVRLVVPLLLLWVLPALTPALPAPLRALAGSARGTDTAAGWVAGATPVAALFLAAWLLAHPLSRNAR